MTDQNSSLGEKFAELRSAFDLSFAETPASVSAPVADFLAIRVGADPYAVRIAEISGLYADRRVTSLPSAVGELLGIVGVRGAIVPVYDLRLLLGYPAEEAPRWLMVVAENAVGLAFDALEGHLRVSNGTTGLERSAQVTQPLIRGVLNVGQVSRPIVQVASLLEAIKRRAQNAPIQEE